MDRVEPSERALGELDDACSAAVRDRVGGGLGHLVQLFSANQRRAPMVTVLDGASHALSFMGSVFGAPVVPLGVDTFGQSRTIGDLCAYAGIDVDHIVDAVLLSIDLGQT